MSITDNGKTHFADDATLEYIASLERQLAEAQTAAKHWEDTCHSQHEETVEPLRAKLKEAQAEIGYPNGRL